LGLLQPDIRETQKAERELCWDHAALLAGTPP
jgi:hypothetical protein